jgi:hypothetical protein
MHRAATDGDDAAVTLDHGGYLLALIRMDQENDLVMPHLVTPYGHGLPLTRSR